MEGIDELAATRDYLPGKVDWAGEGTSHREAAATHPVRGLIDSRQQPGFFQLVPAGETRQPTVSRYRNRDPQYDSQKPSQMDTKWPTSLGRSRSLQGFLESRSLYR